MSTFGFIGLGDMGLPMARHVLETGHELVVWNRSAAKMALLVSLGARAAASPADVMRRCRWVALCVTSHTAVGEIALGRDGLLSAGPFTTRRIVVDCSTGDPEKTREIASRADGVGIGWIDAPVSGGPQAAATGMLTMFLGGKMSDMDAAEPLLRMLGTRRTPMGPAGAGQVTKICNQLIVCANLFAIAEAIALGRKAGIAVELLPEALRGGFADSLPLKIFGPRMSTHSFTPRLGSVALMNKDLALALELAERCSAMTPISRQCSDLFARLSARPGNSPDEDVSSVIDLFEIISNDPSGQAR